MIIVNPVIPLEMALNLERKPEFEDKKPTKDQNKSDQFQQMLESDMRDLGSKDPRKDIEDYKKRKRTS